MTIVKVDISKTQAAILGALPRSADRDRIVRGLGAAAMAQWKKLAQERLRSTSRDYIAGLEHTTEAGKAVIVLNGVLPNMIERGWRGGDMREWMLASGKAKQGKNGPYLVVPFRHGGPETGGRNVGPSMPTSIYEAARRLKPTISRPGPPVATQGGQTTVYGQRLHPGLPMKAQAKQILQRKEKPWHASSIYLGMIRKGKEIAGGRVQTTGYQTFRTISMHTRDKGRHWVHPGIQARNLARQVNVYLGKIATAIVAQATGGPLQR